MKTIETMIQATLALHPEIRLVILFGSLATGQGHHGSDVDLAIDAGQPLEVNAKMSLMAELAECTGRPVDLIDLQTVGEPLLGQILKAYPEPFDEKVHSGWKMASKQKASDAAGKKYDKAARAQFAKLAAKFPNTPWAVLSKRENLTALGLDWQAY